MLTSATLIRDVNDVMFVVCCDNPDSTVDNRDAILASETVLLMIFASFIPARIVSIVTFIFS